ncbi:MAG: hypothetical protein M2R45_01290 [Verrucomicrobia subdivision 3 bacterium]|nr:hypothetical protein [Limisphaerales bacterium]MCS1415156.1 hypothetical protein [Limisphaerales bacterium]
MGVFTLIVVFGKLLTGTVVGQLGMGRIYCLDGNQASFRGGSTMWSVYRRCLASPDQHDSLTVSCGVEPRGLPPDSGER